MENANSIDNNAGKSVSLSSYGSRIQFGVAVALISVIPLLTLAYILILRSLKLRLPIASVLVIGVILSVTVCLGYWILACYLRTIVRLRHHMEKIAQGELPDHVELMQAESDVSAIEEYFNMIIAGMRERIATIQEQNQELQEAERQRIMHESLCTVCHCLGQPATTINCYLGLLKSESLTASGKENLCNCIKEAEKINEAIGDLQNLMAYRTEPYCLIPDKPISKTQRIIQTRKDKAVKKEME